MERIKAIHVMRPMDDNVMASSQRHDAEAFQFIGQNLVEAETQIVGKRNGFGSLH